MMAKGHVFGRSLNGRLREKLFLHVLSAVLMMENDPCLQVFNERLGIMVKALEKEDASFIVRLAIYARRQMGIKHVPLRMVVELSRWHRGDDLVRRALRRLIIEPNEIVETLILFQKLNGRRGRKKLHGLSKQIQKGVADSFNRMTREDLDRYGNEREVSLKDALFLVHPKAKDEEQQRLFDEIIANTYPRLGKTDKKKIVESRKGICLGQAVFRRRRLLTKILREKEGLRIIWKKEGRIVWQGEQFLLDLTRKMELPLMISEEGFRINAWSNQVLKVMLGIIHRDECLQSIEKIEL